MASKKILLINDTIQSHGGAETYCTSLKNLLEKNGYQTKLIGGDVGVGLRDSFFSRWYSFKYYKLVQDAILNFSPDIIHVHNISRVISPSILVPSATYNIPIVQTVHDYHYICPKLWMINDQDKQITTHNSFLECLMHHLPKKNIVYSTLQSLKTNFHKRYIKKYINHFICPSRDLAHWYAKKFGESKVSFLPLFVGKSVKSLNQKENHLLYVGRLSKEKGIELLIQAIMIIIPDFPTLKLQIIGDGPEKEQLIGLVNKLGLKKNIDFINKIANDKITTYYQQATALIIPSIWVENCPMVALEAIGANCPIIASNSGGLKDLVRDNHTGFLFKRNDVQDLSLKIKMLLQNKKRVKQFSHNQHILADKLNEENHIKEIKNIYQMVSSQKN